LGRNDGLVYDFNGFVFLSFRIFYYYYVDGFSLIKGIRASKNRKLRVVSHLLRASSRMLLSTGESNSDKKKGDEKGFTSSKWTESLKKKKKSPVVSIYEYGKI
jgi:hypothetical protein